LLYIFVSFRIKVDIIVHYMTTARSADINKGDLEWPWMPYST